MKSVLDTAFIVVFCVVFFPLALLMIVLRWGTAFPRLGRWLDARLYSAYPRFGHLFVEDAGGREDTT
jgi:hypothetical protein